MRTKQARSPGQRAGLAADAILAVARQLVEEDGVDALTMRALASRLGVAPNSLYSHVPDKSALLDAVLDDALGGVDVGGLEALGWRAGLIELMRRFRRLLLDRADLLPLLIARPTRGPNALRLGETTLRLLEMAGVRGAAAAEALQVVFVFTLGYAADEAPRRADPDSAQRQARSRRAFAAGGQPRVAELATEIASPTSNNTFETGLGWLLDGIAQATG